MNGWERIRAALEGRWPDRRPVMLHNFMMAAREAGLTQREFRRSPDQAARAFIDAAEKYDLDGVLIDIDTAVLAGAVGVGVDFPDDEPARACRPRLASLEEVSSLEMPDISKDDRVQMWCETCRIVKHHFGSEKCVRGNCDQAPFSLASMMRSPAEWMIDLFDASPLAERLLEFCTNVCLQFIELVAATGVDMLSNGDSPAGPEMVSPAMYRKFAFPYEKRLAEASHRLRLPYALHICGNTALILEDMVLTGTDAIELDFKTELRRIHRVSGDRVTLFGTIDPSGVLKFGTPADVKRKVAELLEVYRDSPRLVVNAGCALPPDCPEQNIRALTETARHPALQTSG